MLRLQFGDQAHADQAGTVLNSIIAGWAKLRNVTHLTLSLACVSRFVDLVSPRTASDGRLRASDRRGNRSRGLTRRAGLAGFQSGPSQSGVCLPLCAGG